MFHRSFAVLLVAVVLLGCGMQPDPAKQAAEQAQEAKNVAAMQIGLLVAALDAYKTSVGEFPSTRQGLQALRIRPADLPRTKRWEGSYLISQGASLPLKMDMLTDPWGHPYQYRLPGTHKPDGCDVWSLGPDGVDGSEDDIGNWNAPSLSDMLNPDGREREKR
jgi:general secretion pathway protein G